jgi:hypothetical protein
MSYLIGALHFNKCIAYMLFFNAHRWIEFAMQYNNTCYLLHIKGTAHVIFSRHYENQ